MAIPPNQTNSITAIKDFFDRHKGLQRPNRFSMSFNGLPPALSGLVPANDFQPIGVMIGARAIDSVADNLAGYGLGRSVPRSQKFPQGVMLTFAVTNDHFITDFYDTWFNLIYSGGRQRGTYKTPFQLSYYDDIIAKTQMKINILDPNGNINRIYTFFEIYPIECLPIELSMMKTNDYMTYQVLMMFRDFTFKPGT
jgi:hypothetical protein